MTHREMRKLNFRTPYYKLLRHFASLRGLLQTAYYKLINLGGLSCQRFQF